MGRSIQHFLLVPLPPHPTRLDFKHLLLQHDNPVDLDPSTERTKSSSDLRSD